MDKCGVKEPREPPKEGRGGGGGVGGVGGGGSQACRCLFGPVDHREVRGALRREMAQLNDRDSHRWNFNFREERPLEGRYSWERVADPGGGGVAPGPARNGSTPANVGPNRNSNDGSSYSEGEGHLQFQQPQPSSSLSSSTPKSLYLSQPSSREDTRYQFLPVHHGGCPTSGPISALQQYETLEELPSSTGGFQPYRSLSSSVLYHDQPLQPLPTQAAAAVDQTPHIPPPGLTLEEQGISRGEGSPMAAVAAGQQSVLFHPIPTTTTTQRHPDYSLGGNDHDVATEPMDIDHNNMAISESHPGPLLGAPPSLRPEETVELETANISSGSDLVTSPQGDQSSSQEGRGPPGEGTTATAATCPPPGGRPGAAAVEGVKRRQPQITGAQSTDYYHQEKIRRPQKSSEDLS